MAETTEIERAYGLLWSDSGGTAKSHEARRLLLGIIGKEGQRRGIEYALADRSHVAPVAVSAIWLKNIGNQVIVEAEMDGEWVTIITEHAGGAYSHIAESGGILNAFLRKLGAKLHRNPS